MNQKEIWCVVNPTVGLPLFLGTVLFIALLVHFSILTHTSWFGGYWEGGAKKTHATAMVAPADQAAPAR